MSDDYRHHRAVQVVLVPYPVPMESPEIGSPKTVKSVKPGPYQPAPREAWRPARAIPGRLSKAQRLVKWLDAMRRQDAELKAYMQPDPAAMQSWLARGGVSLKGTSDAIAPHAA